MQTTIRRDFSVVGTGLHSGRPARMTVRAASANHGIWFRRVDVTDKENMIAAAYDTVCNTTLCTELRNEYGVGVSTVEHLLAALAGCGIHNALIDIDGPEVPIMDGSSQRFVREILTVGIVEHLDPVRVMRVLKPVRVEEGAAWAERHPYDGLHISFDISFPDAVIGDQVKSLDMSNGAFVRELSDCRTFCRRSDVEKMQSAGLALGGSLENAVVADGDRLLNPEGFRRNDECVRHKILDALGDLVLAGAPMLAHYKGHRAGHSTTNTLLRKLFSTPNAWRSEVCTPELARSLPGAGVRMDDLRKVG